MKLLYTILICLLIVACRQEPVVPSHPDSKAVQQKTDQPVISKVKIRADSLRELYMKTYEEFPATQAQRDNNAIVDFAIANTMELDLQESGLYHKIYSFGKGDSIKLGDAIRIQYTGYFLDGKVLESTLNSGGPSSISVGTTIKGWTEVLLKMRMGDKAKVVIPSHLAYGKMGNREKILPNTCLFFDIEIMGYVRDKMKEPVPVPGQVWEK